MKIETFFENFELLTDAPNAVVKLRKLILQLAVRGKLVAQTKDDEQVSALLENIKHEKNNLILGKRLKQEEKLLAVQKSEKIYNIPENWMWVRLGEVINCLDHIRKPINKDERAIRFGTVPYYGANGQVGWIDDFLFDEPLVLVVEDETFIGRQLPFCYKIEGKCWVNNHAHVLQPTSGIDVDFLNYSLAYYPFVNLTSGTTGRKKLTKSALLNVPYALPPLAEQKRIVEKCDRLLSTCDEIEKRQQQRQESIVRMNESAIAQLLSSQNPDDFRQHWQRICNNFDLLYSIPETIPKLRQAILQLAVQGKLVRQNSNDEPASVLLRKIKAQKEHLIKDKKIPKDKPIALLDDSELPYEVAENWNWVRLGELAKVIEYGTSEKSSELGGDIPVFRMNNIREGKLLFDNLKYVSAEIKDLPRLFLQKGDLLFNRTNSYELVGKTGVFKGESNQYTFASYLIRISILSEYISPDFINLAINSTYFRQTQIEPEITQQCGQANFNGTKLKNTLIPLPPLAEQKRIVEKCDRLMSLCDTLEAKLKQGRDSSEKLMEVAAKQVLTA